MTLQLLLSEFPYIWVKFDFLFFQDLEYVTGDGVDHEDVDTDAGDEPQDGGEIDPGQEEGHCPSL